MQFIPEPASQKDSTLLNLLTGLSIEGFEKSFKMSKNVLLDNRFLIGVNNVEHHRRQLFNTCHTLNMPNEHIQSLRLHFPRANRAYFGFEKNLSQDTYKVYLEFWNQYAQQRAINPNYKKAFPLYIGYKWNALNNTQNSLTSYTLYPEISLQEILQKIANIYQNHSDTQAPTIAQQIIKVAAEKTNELLLKYLEVTENNNPRRSFDINLYKADINIQDIHHQLKTMQENYKVNPTTFDNLYHSIQHQSFGHLSGGIDKSNNDFMTFYYESNRLTK